MRELIFAAVAASFLGGGGNLGYSGSPAADGIRGAVASFLPTGMSATGGRPWTSPVRFGW